MNHKNAYHILLFLMTILLFTACSDGGGDSSTSVIQTTNSSSVAVRAQTVSAGDTTADPFVTAQCGDLGGIAVYSGIDSNNDSILSIDEQNPTPQVVCNGSNGTTPAFNVDQLLIGDVNCPSGGIKVTLDSDISYLCNTPVNDEIASITTTDFTGTGIIRGTLPSSAQSSPQRVLSRADGLNGVGSINTILSGLFVTPNKTNNTVDKDIVPPKADTTQAIPTPVIKPIPVTVNEDNTYEVPNLPSGEYSMIYIDGDTGEGTKIDDIIVQPDAVKTIDITKTTSNANVTLNVKSLILGAELENVRVHLNELNEDVFTDADGFAGFSNFPEGTYSLTISNEGYVSKYITFSVISGQTTDLQTIELNSKKGQLVGSVSANVVDDLANIVVYAKSADGSVYATLTDSSGNYTFNALPVGSGYSVLAYAHDFESSKVDNIEIVNAQTSSANTIVLSKYKSEVGSISGFARFKDVSQSLGHAGIIVSVEGSDKETITSRDGSFILNSLTSGTYTLNFTDSNHLTQTKQITIAVGATSMVDSIELLPITGSLTGRVVDESGNNVASAYITVITSSQTLTAITGINGTYIINGILAGVHEVIVAKGGYGAGASVVKIEANLLSDTTSTPTVITRKLLTGAINLQGSTDNSGATVSLVDSDIPSAQTDSSGNFILYGVGAGNYQLQVSKSGFVTQTLSLAISSDNGYVIPYTVELELSKSTLEGVATLYDKISSSGIKVEILGTEYFTYTDSVGKWSLNVAVGNYSDGVKFSKDNFTEVTVDETATVIENGSYSVSSVELRQISQNIIGKITVAGETIFSATTLSLIGTSGEALGVTANKNPNSDGTFEISALPLGNYTYTIAYPDGLHESIVSSFTLDGTTNEYDLGNINLRTSYLNINNNDTYTNSTTVTLSIGNTDAASMEIVENGITSAKESFTATKTFILSGTDGEKTLSLNLYDADNNPLPAISDTIILDTTLQVSSFTLSGATKKGDTLKLSLNLGETQARVTANIPSIIDGLKLLDNGTGGDTTANDGVYERTLLITTPYELNTTVEALITDVAGNTLTHISDNRLVLSTNPSIENLQVVSNVASASMSISFTTDEPTTSKIFYGDDSSYGNELSITTSLSTNHSVTLTNLTPNVLTYFKLEVQDAALNVSTLSSQSKLAPPPPLTLNIQAGDQEIGLVWSEVSTNGVIGYNLYRSNDGGSFIKVNTTPITDIYYLDTVVSNDTAYSYKVTTVDDNDNESIQSSEVTATPLSTLAGPTEIVGGVIDVDTLWLSSRSPYNVTADIKINEGTTLLLLPGVAVNFSGDSRYMLVEGALSGYGTKSDNILLTADGFTENTDVMQYAYFDGGAGYIGVDGGEVTLNYVTVENAGFAKTNGDIYLNNATVTLNTCTSNKYFAITKITESNITEIKSQLNGFDCYGHSININAIKDSNITYSGNNDVNATASSGVYVSAQTFINSSITDGYISLVSADDSDFNNVSIGNDSWHAMNIENSIINNSTISFTAPISLKYNVITNLKKFHQDMYDNSFSVTHNYWGTTNLETITALLNYSPTQVGDTPQKALYPIISTSDLFNADFDNDGIPDYIDSDNDNDGYSDLQEDKESDPQFGSIYNPLDAASHPNSAKDNDYDGIIDDDDDDDDNDGLSDVEEGNYQTNPMIADSDGDGVSDGVEVTYKYDPLDKASAPIVGNKSNIHIDSSYANSDGVVYIIGVDNSDLNLVLTNVTIAPGTKIILEKDTQLNINDSTISGTKVDPIIFRSSGAGNGSLSLSNTKLSYANIKIATNLNMYSNSIISHSDISFSRGYLYGGSIDFSVLMNSDYTAAYGIIISNSYISGNGLAYVGQLNNCYVANGYVSQSSVNNSYIASNIYWDSIINNSIVMNIGSSYNYKITDSDINVNDLYEATPAFFDGAFIQNDAGDFNSSLGVPEDQVGDGVAETVFTLGGTTYTVDGITNPRSTKNFPAWVNDPAIKQYFWDPTDVGCLWDKNNPDLFPEP